MHNLYPLARGDPLCPLGFHPQVRWPTRCKRCFRDYKEHGGKKRDEPNLKRDSSTASTPSLSLNLSDGSSRRSWVSSSNLAGEKPPDPDCPSSWISTPDLANLQDDTQAVPTFSITLPKRKPRPMDSTNRTVSDSFSLVRDGKQSIYDKNDSLSTRVKKLQAAKESSTNARRIQIKEVKTISEEPNNHDVQFLIQVKRNDIKPKESFDSSGSDEYETVSNAGTETTDTTLVGADFELKEQLDSLKKELDQTKTRCERLEREKSDILLRRLAAMETTTSKTSASEVLKLQQKCNEMKQQLEDYRDEKRSLTLRVKELEADLDLRPTAQEAQKVADELRSKLLAAETVCEELMDENEDMKKDLRDMEEQIDEMQDNFREDQAVEYTSIKKELDQTTKNCRILSFKLRKAERKVEQLEHERDEVKKKLTEVSGDPGTLSHLQRIKQLEQDLKISNEVSLRLQKELEESMRKLDETTKSVKKKPPLLGSLGKASSTDGGKKMSRESLTRGGSQDDPVQLLRDLQDSLEREADLREQLRFAEEEGENLRKKVSRIEEDNDSLVLQLKKMATRARNRKLSPTNQRLTPEPQENKPNHDDESVEELKLQLELSEQEASVLRKKVEELEVSNRKLKTRSKDLHDKAGIKETKKIITSNSAPSSIDGQKVKVLEDEANELRKKLIQKERDCERLHAEAALNQKRSKGMQKAKSLDMDQQTLDLKRQLQVVEQEAAMLRAKVKDLEVENDKLLGENKKLNLSTKLKAPKLTPKVDLNKFLSRIPKKVTALTSRDQLKTMITDLEKEISDILSSTTELNDSTTGTGSGLELKKTMKELEELRKKLEEAKQEIENEKVKYADAVKTSQQVKDDLTKIENEKKKLKLQVNKLEKEQTDKNDEIGNLKDQLRGLDSKQDEIVLLTRKIDSLKSTIDDKDDELKKLRKSSEELQKLSNEVTSKEKKIEDLENRLLKFETKYSECDKKLREHTKLLETKLDKAKLKIKELEEQQIKLEDEKKKLNFQIENLNMKIKGSENTIDQKDKLIKQLEASLNQERDQTKLKIGEMEGRELSKLKDELSKKAVHLAELESKLELSEKSKTNSENKLKKAELEKKNTKLEQEKKIKELEIDLQNERKKIEVLKTTAEKEQRNRDLELTSLKTKIKRLEAQGVKGLEMKRYHENVEKLEDTLTRERQKYDDLTAKYEILEEEHVVIKAKLVMEKETLENQFKNLRREQDQLESELKTLRDTYNTKQDAWIKEKLEMEQKIKDKSRVSYSGGDSDKQRLKALFEEKQSEVDQIKKEYDQIHNQMEYLRKENDDLNKKLDDYEKVNKVQRNISADSSAMEQEIRQLRIKLNNADKLKKTDIGECKMRYESQLSLMNQELQSLQNQVMRFKRERDNYKHMLETAQKTMSDLKHVPRPDKGSKPNLNYDELEESKSKIATLEQQINCMEDELSEARLECSRLKTELISERSSWDVRLSELHSKVNELEEEKVLNSGRTKIVGLRTKMELAWQKEREEQQRLLQETATLARDLRQTLFEVERERDKERLEAKRKYDQFKKSVDEDQDETKRKITELQCDLLELRDAHAKLRTTNEKLRREKERYEKEREEHRIVKTDRRRFDFEEEKKIERIIEQVDTLKQLAPELFFSREEAGFTPTPPRRTKSKSRETSPVIGSRESSMLREDKQMQIQQVMQNLVHSTENLRKLQKFNEDEEDRQRLRRASMRRATSTETENTNSRKTNLLKNSSLDRQGSLHRKSLSLEHNIQAEQKIWRDGDSSMSSLQSFESEMDAKRSKRDSSLDSRLSGGSTQSDVGDKKKSKGLMSKLMSLTKSRSIDDDDPGLFSTITGLGSKNNSNSDVNDEKGSKKDLRGRLAGIFRRSGSSSRSNSMERKHETSSTQRPLVRNGSNTNLS